MPGEVPDSPAAGRTGQRRPTAHHGPAKTCGSVTGCTIRRIACSTRCVIPASVAGSTCSDSVHHSSSQAAQATSSGSPTLSRRSHLPKRWATGHKTGIYPRTYGSSCSTSIIHRMITTTSESSTRHGRCGGCIRPWTILGRLPEFSCHHPHEWIRIQSRRFSPIRLMGCRSWPRPGRGQVEWPAGGSAATPSHCPMSCGTTSQGRIPCALFARPWVE